MGIKALTKTSVKNTALPTKTFIHLMSKKHRIHSPARLTGGLAASFAGLALLASPASASSINWSGATGGTWSTGTNWSGSATPTSADDVTILGPNNVAGALTINEDTAALANSLTFTNTAATILSNTTSGANQSITVGNGITTGTGAVTIGSATANQNINIALGGSQTWNIGAGGMTVSNVVSGTGAALTKSGTGTLTLSSANTYSGGTTISAGTIATSNSSALGTGSLTMNGGTFKNGATANVTNNIVIGSGTNTLTENGTTNFNFTGTLSGAGNVTFGGGGGNASIGLSFTSNTMTSGTITLSGGTTGIARIKNVNASSSALAWQINGGSTEVSGTFNFGSFNGAGNFAAFNGNSGNVTYSVGALNTDATYSGILSSTGTNSSLSVTKVGTGTWTLSGANTYTKAGTGATPTTTVSAGKLQISNTTGSGTGASVIAVSGGTSATFGGTGTASGAVIVTNGSRLAPGTITTASNFGSAGTLTLSGGLTLTSANMDFDLSTTAGGSNDKIALSTGALSFSTLNFNFSGTTLDTSTAYTHISTTGSLTSGDVTTITSDFTNVTNGSSYTATYSFLSGTGLQVTFTAIPESHEFAIAIVGLLCVMVVIRRRNQEI
jgi:autotransporter-associated beta strand protein